MQARQGSLRRRSSNGLTNCGPGLCVAATHRVTLSKSPNYIINSETRAILTETRAEVTEFRIHVGVPRSGEKGLVFG